MRKLLLALFLTLPVYAALPAGVQWNVRTDGSDSNGGGFVTGASGTDRSDAAAAFCTATDFATTGTASTSVTCPYSAASVGNLIQITAGGCSAGFYQVVSVATVTATLDRSAGTSTGCTAALGGSLLTPAKNITSLVNGNTTWFKYNATPYTITTKLQPPTVTNGVLYWRGYDVTHGDETANRPTITTATDSTKLWEFNNAGSYWFSNFIFSNTASVKAQCMQVVGSPVSAMVLDRNKFTGCTVGLEANFSTGDVVKNLTATRNEFTANSSFGIRQNQNTYAAYNWCHDNASGYCFSLGPSTTPNPESMILLDNCAYAANLVTVESNVNYLQLTVVGNTIIAAPGNAIASNIAVGAFPIIMNNILQGGTGGGSTAINMGINPFSNGGTAINQTNAYGNNAGGNFTNWQAGTGDVTLSSDPTISSSTGNCALSAGGITALQGLGFPGVGVMGTGHITIGALEPTGAGSTSAGAAGHVF